MLKKLSKFTLLGLCGLLTVGCSSVSEETTAKKETTEVAKNESEQKSNVKCELIAKTGSHLKRHRCTTKSQRYAEREKAKNALDKQIPDFSKRR